MTEGKTNQDHTFPELPLLGKGDSDRGKDKQFPPRRRLDLIDVERFGGKTYQQKRYRQPHVYVGVADQEIGLELINYFVMQAELTTSTPFVPGDIKDIYTFTDIPTPFAPVSPYEPDLSPLVFYGSGNVGFNQAGIYNAYVDFEAILTDNIQAIEFFLESTTNGTLMSYKIAASAKEVELLGELDDPDLVDGDVTSTGEPVTGRVEPEVTITHTFGDLSDTFATYSGNKTKNVYIEKDEQVYVKFVITPTSAGAASGSIEASMRSMKFLRPNR